LECGDAGADRAPGSAHGIKQTVATNAVAAILLALAAAFHPARRSRALLVFSAIEVATLAVAQALSLARRGEHS
jgi:hypothetical protein